MSGLVGELGIELEFFKCELLYVCDVNRFADHPHRVTTVSSKLVIGSATVNKVAYLMRMQQLMLGYVISKSVACSHLSPGILEV